jgi:hypothetical protein
MAANEDEDGSELVPATERNHHEVSLFQVAPGLFRVAATSCWRAVSWTVDTSITTGSKIVNSAVSGASPAQIVQETTAEFRSAARRALGFGNGDEEHAFAEREGERRLTTDELRQRGAALLYRSADVRFTEDMHPAYERILGEIAPDEARILRFLALNGAQPTVDVRTSRPFGVGSELIAEGLSMIGEQAGCRFLDRTNSYLNNLFRLGLVWFSKEKVEATRYQVVEVQPVVVEAMKRAGRAPSTVHRSIHLTPFGQDFCATCLPMDD